PYERHAPRATAQCGAMSTDTSSRRPHYSSWSQREYSQRSVRCPDGVVPTLCPRKVKRAFSSTRCEDTFSGSVLAVNSCSPLSSAKPTASSSAAVLTPQPRECG